MKDEYTIEIDDNTGIISDTLSLDKNGVVYLTHSASYKGPNRHGKGADRFAASIQTTHLDTIRELVNLTACAWARPLRPLGLLHHLPHQARHPDLREKGSRRAARARERA